MGSEHPDRLAGLHQQGLVPLELAQRADDAIEALPVPRGAPDAAVDDELLRLLGDLGIEVVHEHPQRRLGEPALRRHLGAPRTADRAGVVDAGLGHGSYSGSKTDGNATATTSVSTPFLTSSAAKAISGAR